MRIVAVRGTGEPLRGGMTEPVIRDHLGVDVVRLSYPAAIFPMGLGTHQSSSAAGRAHLRQVDSWGPWVGVGYSLGAEILGDAVASGEMRNCRGLVLLADPGRHRGQCANKGVPASRWGIAGERWVPGRVASFAIPDDPITACPGDNTGRLVANVLTGRRQPLQPGMANPFEFVRWLSKYPGRHVAYGEQMPGDDHTYLEAARDAVGGML